MNEDYQAGWFTFCIWSSSRFQSVLPPHPNFKSSVHFFLQWHLAKHLVLLPYLRKPRTGGWSQVCMFTLLFAHLWRAFPSLEFISPIFPLITQYKAWCLLYLFCFFLWLPWEQRCFASFNTLIRSERKAFICTIKLNGSTAAVERHSHPQLRLYKLVKSGSY